MRKRINPIEISEMELRESIGKLNTIEDWNNISKKKLLIEVIDRYKDKLNWYQLVRHNKFTIDQINKYLNCFDIQDLVHYQKLTEKFIFDNVITKYKGYNLYTIMDIVFKYQKLSEKFIIDYIENYNDNENIWHSICFFQKLSLEFIEKYKDRIKWTMIIKNMKFTEEFILSHKDYFRSESLFAY